MNKDNEENKMFPDPRQAELLSRAMSVGIKEYPHGGKFFLKNGVIIQTPPHYVFANPDPVRRPSLQELKELLWE